MGSHPLSYEEFTCNPFGLRNLRANFPYLHENEEFQGRGGRGDGVSDIVPFWNLDRKAQFLPALPLQLLQQRLGAGIIGDQLDQLLRVSDCRRKVPLVALEGNQSVEHLAVRWTLLVSLLLTR